VIDQARVFIAGTIRWRSGQLARGKSAIGQRPLEARRAEHRLPDPSGRQASLREPSGEPPVSPHPWGAPAGFMHRYFKELAAHFAISTSDVCTDLQAWTASGYKTLPAAQ
jgi:hypothetical protein